MCLIYFEGFHLWIQPSASSHPKRPLPLLCHYFSSVTGRHTILVFPSSPHTPIDTLDLGACIVILVTNCAKLLMQLNPPYRRPTINSPILTPFFSRGEPANILTTLKMHVLI